MTNLARSIYGLIVSTHLYGDYPPRDGNNFSRRFDAVFEEFLFLRFNPLTHMPQIMLITLLIFTSIIKAVIAWFIIVYIGTNLVGFIGRGFWKKPLDPNKHHEFLKKEIKKWNNSGVVVTILSIFTTIGVYFYLYYYWGVLFLIAIILVMISRIPDLYWEIRILPKELGVLYPVPKNLIQKAIKSKSQSNPFSNILLASLTWVALAVLFVAFFVQN